MLSDERIKALVEHPRIAKVKLEGILGVYKCQYPEQVFKSIHRCVHPGIVHYVLGTWGFYNRKTHDFDKVQPAPQYAFDNCIDYHRGEHWIMNKCISKCSVSSLPKFISDIHIPHIAMWLAERNDCPSWIAEQIFDEHFQMFEGCVDFHNKDRIADERGRPVYGKYVSYGNVGKIVSEQQYLKTDFWSIGQTLAESANSQRIIRYFLGKTPYVYCNPNIEHGELWDALNHHERYNRGTIQNIWHNPASTDEMLEAIWTLPLAPGEYRSNGYRMQRHKLSHRRMSVDFVLRHLGEIDVSKLKKDWGDDMPNEIRRMIPLVES